MTDPHFLLAAWQIRKDRVKRLEKSTKAVDKAQLKVEKTLLEDLENRILTY